MKGQAMCEELDKVHVPEPEKAPTNCRPQTPSVEHRVVTLVQTILQ